MHNAHTPSPRVLGPSRFPNSRRIVTPPKHRITKIRMVHGGSTAFYLLGELGWTHSLHVHSREVLAWPVPLPAHDDHSGSFLLTISGCDQRVLPFEASPAKRLGRWRGQRQQVLCVSNSLACKLYPNVAAHDCNVSSIHDTIRSQTRHGHGHLIDAEIKWNPSHTFMMGVRCMSVLKHPDSSIW